MLQPRLRLLWMRQVHRRRNYDAAVPPKPVVDNAADRLLTPLPIRHSRRFFPIFRHRLLLRSASRCRGKADRRRCRCSSPCRICPKSRPTKTRHLGQVPGIVNNSQRRFAVELCEFVMRFHSTRSSTALTSFLNPGHSGERPFSASIYVFGKENGALGGALLTFIASWNGFSRAPYAPIPSSSLVDASSSSST